MLKKRVGCLFVIFLFLLHFFNILPSFILFLLDIFALIFIVPIILRGFFYKISHQLTLSYFLIGFVPIFASLVLIITAVELGGVLYLQNQFSYSLRTWTLEMEREMLDLYLNPDPKVFYRLEEKYPGLKIKLQKDMSKYYFGTKGEEDFLKKNGLWKNRYILSYNIGEDIAINVPLEQVLRKEDFFNFKLDWAIVSSGKSYEIFKESGEKNFFKKPLIYSVYFLEGGDGKNASILLMRTSLNSIYRSLSAVQPVVSNDIIVALKVSAIFLLFLTLLSFFYAGYFIYKTSRNISKLSEGVGKFTEGDLDWRVKFKGKDELSSLARNFNQMADSIKEYISKLKEKAQQEKEIELASRIQKSLLPEESVFSVFKKTNLYFLPSRGIGGDYFDIFSTDEKILLFIGDASGHGISASLTMAMTKAIITGLIYRNTPPSCILPEVHSILINTGLESQYITLQILEIDKNKRVINFYNAGHPPPFFISKDKVQELRLNSFPIGIFSGPGFDMLSIPYEEGDILFLYTDGLLEIEEGDLDLKDLKKLIEKSLPAESISPLILQEVEKLLKGRQPIDDLTILEIHL
ncbi:MAG: SpoIIE family protein phosphatase [Thermoanaerobaculia bacterium]